MPLVVADRAQVQNNTQVAPLLATHLSLPQEQLWVQVQAMHV
jgi:hypothetical protein